jgi:hypothetical protein
MIRLRTALVLCAVLALTVGVATATAGEGNPPKHQKQLCKEGGWQHWVRAEDHSPFQSKHDCYSYIHQGGTLSLTSKALCESFGGTFSTGALVPLWACNGWTAVDVADFSNKVEGPFVSACHADGGNSVAASGFGSGPIIANLNCFV